MTDRFLERVFAGGSVAGGRFLEIGAGGSPWPAYVARRLGAEAWGIDCRARGLAHGGARRGRRARAASRSSRATSSTARSWRAAAFDVVYSGGFIERFPSPRAVLRAPRRAARAGRRGGHARAQPERRQRARCRRSPIADDLRAPRRAHAGVARRRARRGRPRARRAHALPRSGRSRLREPDARGGALARRRCGARCRTPWRCRAAPAWRWPRAPTGTAAASSRR